MHGIQYDDVIATSGISPAQHHEAADASDETPSETFAIRKRTTTSNNYYQPCDETRNIRTGELEEEEETSFAFPSQESSTAPGVAQGLSVPVQETRRAQAYEVKDLHGLNSTLRRDEEQTARSGGDRLSALSGQTQAKPEPVYSYAMPRGQVHVYQPEPGHGDNLRSYTYSIPLSPNFHGDRNQPDQHQTNTTHLQVTPRRLDNDGAARPIVATTVRCSEYLCPQDE